MDIINMISILAPDLKINKKSIKNIYFQSGTLLRRNKTFKFQSEIPRADRSLQIQEH